VANRAAAFEGSAGSAALIVAFFGAWLAWGAAIGFPRWWELIVTAGIPFLTLLLLVFLQHRQEHDDRAIQLKLDELIRASARASNSMMTVEDASREDLERIQTQFRDQAGS
jgi:low affinity Fe/Cu permease